MGVPKFYRWISERYPCLSEVIAEDQIPEFDNLYLDMNGIIHSCSHPDDDDVFFRITEEQIFKDIFRYIDFLFGIIKPKKVFFMAVDGVAPRAKLNQQRARRFMSAKNAEEARKKAERSGHVLSEEKPFDSNCITPVILYFQCPGEGEHKIMDFIRTERSKSDYDVNTRHCLYGLDADLIMLGLCSHEPHFALLREEVKFGRPRKNAPKLRCGVESTTFHLLHLSLLREYIAWEFRPIQDKVPFEFNLESIIDDWVLMGFLVGNDFIPHLPYIHIHEDALPLLYTSYMNVLPQLNGYINEAGELNLKRFEVFLKEVAKNDKRNFIEKMNDEAYLASKKLPIANVSTNQDDDLEPFQFNDDEMLQDEENITPSYKGKGAFDSDEEEEVLRESKSVQGSLIPSASEILVIAAITGCLSAYPTSSNDEIAGNLGDCAAKSDDVGDDASVLSLDNENYGNDYLVSWTPSVDRAFRNHKRNYYYEKLKYENISKEQLRGQAEGYIMAIQWNLHYYYHGCCSWSWFYPHHYAPYISDISNFADMKIHFDLSEPFLPFEQLLAVLPAASAECLPKPFQELMVDPNSPISDFYPSKFETDLNGKKNDWEAVVLIPLINEDRLLSAILTKLPQLNDEEKKRNRHGPHLLFTFDPTVTEIIRSTLPNVLGDLQKCTARLQEVDRNKFRISKNEIVYGLLNGVKLDVVFPGFPTMKHIPHTAHLEFADIKVFQQSSTKQSMILKILDRPEMQRDILEIAFDLIGSEVHVNWPILQKALVQEIWTPEKKYSKGDSNEVICDEYSEVEKNLYKSHVANVRKKEFGRCGVDVGIENNIALVRMMSGLSYSFHDGKVIKKRHFDEVVDALPVSLSLLVKNALDSADEPSTALEAYPLGAKVFICSAESKYYGYLTTIKVNELSKRGQLGVVCDFNPLALDFSSLANSNRHTTKWFNAYEIAKYVNCDVNAINRITSSLFMALEDVPQDTSRRYNIKKMNIGLELKSTKRGQSVPEYARRSSDGHWQYSQKALKLIRDYKNSFNEVFTYLGSSENFEVLITAQEVFPLPLEARENKIKDLKAHLQSILPLGEPENENGSFLESSMIAEIEKQVQSSSQFTMISAKRLNVKARAVFRPELCKGKCEPDPNADFRLFDRVMCVRKSHRAPYAEYGTVVGLPNVQCDMIDVLFDKPFFGGKAIRGSKESGVRLPRSWLINITYGIRYRNSRSFQHRKPERSTTISKSSKPHMVTNIRQSAPISSNTGEKPNVAVQSSHVKTKIQNVQIAKHSDSSSGFNASANQKKVWNDKAFHQRISSNNVKTFKPTQINSMNTKPSNERRRGRGPSSPYRPHNTPPHRSDARVTGERGEYGRFQIWNGRLHSQAQCTSTPKVQANTAVNIPVINPSSSEAAKKCSSNETAQAHSTNVNVTHDSGHFEAEHKPLENELMNEVVKKLKETCVAQRSTNLATNNPKSNPPRTLTSTVKIDGTAATSSGTIVDSKKNSKQTSAGKPRVRKSRVAAKFQQL